MEVILMFVVGIALVFLFSLIPTAIVWAIWNYVICSIWAALPVLGFWQVFLIMVFINIVFKGMFSVHIKNKDD